MKKPVEIFNNYLLNLSKIELAALVGADQLSNDLETLKKSRYSAAEQLKSVYRKQIAELSRAFTEKRVETFKAAEEFKKRANELGIDAESTSQYKEYLNVIKAADAIRDYFDKEYQKNI